MNTYVRKKIPLTQICLTLMGIFSRGKIKWMGICIFPTMITHRSTRIDKGTSIFPGQFSSSIFLPTNPEEILMPIALGPSLLFNTITDEICLMIHILGCFSLFHSTINQTIFKLPFLCKESHVINAYWWNASLRTLALPQDQPWSDTDIGRNWRRKSAKLQR